MAIIKRVGKGVGVLVGLGQEAHAHNKAKKADGTAPVKSSDSNNGHECRNETASTFSRVETGQYNEKAIGLMAEPDRVSFTKQPDARIHDLSAPIKALGSYKQLPAPIIIPQKRPNSKARGFLDAYAPALEDCGVNQDTFLDFIDGFNISKQNGAFNVLNLAVALGDIAQAAAVGPSITIHLAAMAVHLSIETAKQLYVNKKTNDYLDKWNETYFKPHGLFAMIMTYDPSSGEASQLLDLDSQAAGAASGETRERFKIASGSSTEAQIPEVCSLIFPENRDRGEGNSFSRAMAFTADYFDRRAQGSYAAKNPDSKLSVRQQQFAGRYADPKIFEHSGLIGVLSGGAIDPCRRHWEEQEKQRKEREALTKSKPEGRERGGLIRGVKQRLSEKVLYLLIVNMPSEDELREAARLRSMIAQ